MPGFLKGALISGAIALSASAVVAAPDAPPTIVLVHGAFAESASWNGVVDDLERSGFIVVAVANPLRGVASDAAYVASLTRSIKGPVVLVGHSYGGAVISAAANDGGDVKSLVYVAVFEPEVGESCLALTGKFPGSTLPPTLAAPVALADGSEDLYIQQDKFPHQFAADVPAAQAKTMAATQRAVKSAALGEPAGKPAWKTIPSWSIYGSADLNIPPAAMAWMSERAHARRTVVVPGASHVVMVSHPHEVADVIRQAAAQ